MAKVESAVELVRFNAFDCFLFGTATRGGVQSAIPVVTRQAYLFGNQHLGRPHLCNLVAPGVLFPHAHAQVEHAYARTDVDLSLLTFRQRATFHRIMSATTVSMVAGDRRLWSDRPLSEMLADRPWEPMSVKDQDDPEEVERVARFVKRREEGTYPVTVPCRVSFSARVDCNADDADLAAIDGLSAIIWLHVEGVRTLPVR